MSTPDPGWYPDPHDPALARWWDGTQWSVATQTPAALLTANAPAVKPRRPIDANFVRLAYVVQALLLLTILVEAGVIWGDMFVLDVADQFLAGAPDVDDAAMSDRITMVADGATVLVFVMTAIAFIRWLYLAHASDRVDPGDVRHKSGWAIGGWFVPVLNLWRPFGVAIDVRRGVLGPGEGATPVMWLWWLGLVVSSAFERAAAREWFDMDTDDVRQYGLDLREAIEADIASGVASIVAAVLAILVVRSLTKLVREAPVVS